MPEWLPKRKRQRLMGRAKTLAALHYGKTGPNPSVGCILLDPMGIVLAEGITGIGGRPHAEEIALTHLSNNGQFGALKDGIAVVTLEPCRQRTNDTASCSERLIDAGISQVYVYEMDYHPMGSGGLDKLRSAGIKVFCTNLNVIKA